MTNIDVDAILASDDVEQLEGLDVVQPKMELLIAALLSRAPNCFMYLLGRGRFEGGMLDELIKLTCDISEDCLVKATGALIDSGASMECRDDTGRSLVHVAVAGFNGQLGTIELLCGKGAPIDTLSLDDESPMSHAIAWGLEDVVCILLNHGADVEFRTGSGYTPLMLAVMYSGCGIGMVRRLCIAGADRSARSANGQSIAMIATNARARDKLDYISAFNNMKNTPTDIDPTNTREASDPE